MTRRELFGLAAGAPFAAAQAAAPHRRFDQYFASIYDGFLRNARRTSASYAVCDFERGTKLPGALARSGKTYDSVSRMMPALAAWVASGRGDATAAEVLRAMFINAFDPQHPDYWGAADSKHQQQRQVESSIVAWTLWVAREQIIPRLTVRQRGNIQAWLASCTQVPVRTNNWAWFTAVNQAVRLDLHSRWPEFAGDEQWMLEDLRFLDSLAAPGADGWYTDSPKEPVYDYYNFWVFASHFLYWNRIAGKRYREWSARFSDRLRTFLDTSPYLFGANGSHVLYGRSLIYRWAVLTPLVLAYEEGLWPHSPGLLRRMVQRNFEYLWSIGAYDAGLGKLRETFTPEGSPAVKETYIDNGHPYWGMQAFALFLIGESDPFWTAREQGLPVERGDFVLRIAGPRLLLTGDRLSGEVRWYQASTPEHYGDKYTKFAYSSHFPFGIRDEPGRAALDGQLVFVNPQSGATARRSHVRSWELLDNGVAIDWTAELDGLQFSVESRIVADGGYEHRTHRIVAPHSAVDRRIEVREGTFALPLDSSAAPRVERAGGWTTIRSSHGLVAARMDNAEVVVTTGENIVYGDTAAIVSRILLRPITEIRTTAYASPLGNISFHPAF